MRIGGFGSFLCGMPSGEYEEQAVPYVRQAREARRLLQEAGSVLIGAGAGMSAAAGAVYGGGWFAEHFREFREKYGADGPFMQDMYSAGFYPYRDAESYWGYWSKQCLLGGIDADHTALHRVLLKALEEKDVFCLTTNADGQFARAGLPEERIFATQGDYFHIQCARGCHPSVYEATDLFRKMDALREDCRIPSELVPRCPVCGGGMVMNLRADSRFVEDGAWHAAEKRFVDFLENALGRGGGLCLLELGVGYNTPSIIRFPFDRLLCEHGGVSLVRINLEDASVPRIASGRAVGIRADIRRCIEDLAAPQ